MSQQQSTNETTLNKSSAKKQISKTEVLTQELKCLQRANCCNVCNGFKECIALWQRLKNVIDGSVGFGVHPVAELGQSRPF